MIWLPVTAAAVNIFKFSHRLSADVLHFMLYAIVLLPFLLPLTYRYLSFSRLRHLFFDGGVDIGKVALAHHTERPHLLPQGHHIVLMQKDTFVL